MRKKLFILYLVFFAILLNAQPKSGKIEILSVKDGIDGLEVTNFFFDNDNKIWLKTHNCLNICTPKHVENVYSGDSLSNIHSKQNIALIKDNNEYIDIFYNNEMDFFDRYNKAENTFTKVVFPHSEGSREKKYIKTLQYNDDVYVISQSMGQLNIYAVYAEKSRNFSLSDDLRVQDIIFFTDGYYILNDENGIFLIDNSNNVRRINTDFLDRKETFMVQGKPVKQDRQIFFMDDRGRLWFSPLQKSGVYLKEKDENNFRLFYELPPDELFTWVSQDRTGKLLFGSTDRYRFTKKYYILDTDGDVRLWDYLDIIVEFPKKIISDDFYKRLFISTYRNLLIIDFTFNDFLSRKLVNTNRIVNAGAYGNLIWGLAQINADSIFFSCEKPFTGIYTTADRQANIYPVKDTMYLFYSLYCKKDNKIWSIGRQNYLSKNNLLVKTDLNTGKNTVIKTPVNIYSIENKSEGELFLGGKTPGDGYCIYAFDPVDLKFTKLLDVPLKPYHIKWNRTGKKLWCLDDMKGPFVVDFNDAARITKLKFDKRNIARYHSIDLGTNDKVFISTNNGVYIWDNKKQKISKHLTTHNGLSANNVCAVAEDNRNNIWISTFYGLNLYYPGIDKLHHYFVEDGLPNNEFNTKSVLIDDNNNIYFGNSNGVVIINTGKFYGNNHKIFFKDIEILDNTMPGAVKRSEGEDIKIHYDNRTEINLDLDLKDWRNIKSTKFYSRLYPVQDKWVDHGIHNKFSFAHLPYGKYELNFVSVNGEGRKSNTLSLPFIVYQKWYETNLFYILLSTILLSILGFISISYFHTVKRKKERTKLQFEKRITELELGILQAQMNPHFIFNSINAIKYNVNAGNKEIVSQYLNDFASLLRLYLESSRMNMITLEMEIKLLNLYLKLQKMRFGEKLEYEINVDPDIDTEYVQVPSMIVQPFVENAVHHGVFHKTTTGHVRINITEDEDENLLIEITDDGIGRKKAMEIKKRLFSPHKSRALQIIEERIEVLNKLYGFIIEIKIKDLVSDTGEALGTSVFIKFTS